MAKACPELAERVIEHIIARGLRQLALWDARAPHRDRQRLLGTRT